MVARPSSKNVISCTPMKFPRPTIFAILGLFVVVGYLSYGWLLLWYSILSSSYVLGSTAELTPSDSETTCEASDLVSSPISFRNYTFRIPAQVLDLKVSGNFGRIDLIDGGKLAILLAPGIDYASIIPKEPKERAQFDEVYGQHGWENSLSVYQNALSTRRSDVTLTSSRKELARVMVLLKLKQFLLSRRNPSSLKRKQYNTMIAFEEIFDTDKGSKIAHYIFDNSEFIGTLVLARPEHGVKPLDEKIMNCALVTMSRS